MLNNAQYGSFADRWNPLAAGSIARRDFYELEQGQGNDARAAALTALFGSTPESALIARDVGGRVDTRFNNFPTAPQAIVAPIRPGQYGPGGVPNTAKATPATLPQAFTSQTPTPAPTTPLKPVRIKTAAFPNPTR